MKLLFTLLLPLMLGQLPIVKPVAQAKVYVCVSRSSVAYHQQRSCRGLGRCTHEIVAVTEKEAQDDYHKRRCLVCY